MTNQEADHIQTMIQNAPLLNQHLFSTSKVDTKDLIDEMQKLILRIGKFAAERYEIISYQNKTGFK